MEFEILEKELVHMWCWVKYRTEDGRLHLDNFKLEPGAELEVFEVLEQRWSTMVRRAKYRTEDGLIHDRVFRLSPGESLRAAIERRLKEIDELGYDTETDLLPRTWKELECIDLLAQGEFDMCRRREGELAQPLVGNQPSHQWNRKMDFEILETDHRPPSDSQWGGRAVRYRTSDGKVHDVTFSHSILNQSLEDRIAESIELDRQWSGEPSTRGEPSKAPPLSFRWFCIAHEMSGLSYPELSEMYRQHMDDHGYDVDRDMEPHKRDST